MGEIADRLRKNAEQCKNELANIHDDSWESGYLRARYELYAAHAVMAEDLEATIATLTAERDEARANAVPDVAQLGNERISATGGQDD